MADLILRDIPQDELDALAARAQRHGRTAEEEARHLVHEAAAEELLVLELERATQAAEAKLQRAAAAPRTAAPAPRRRVRYEPTPRHR